MKKIIVTVLSLTTATILFAQNLTPVDAGSKVHFVIKNFAINTGGDFTGIKGNIKFDAQNVVASTFDVTVNAATIDTDNGTRDGHLKKAEYLDVIKYPTIHLASTKIEKTGKEGTFLFSGNLTIKGVSKPVNFDFTEKKSAGGYLFAGDFEINRRDFNVGGGTFSMSNTVKVSLSVLAK